MEALYNGAVNQNFESGFDTAATAERETGSYSCTRLRNRPRASLSTWQHEQSLRRPPEPWEELSFLHKRPDPWNHFAWRMGFGISVAKSTAVLAVSMGVGRDLENQAEGYGDSHRLVPISAAGLLGAQPLVDRIM